MIYKPFLVTAMGAISVLCTSAALAGPVYQPQGANLTFGDVTHGKRVQSASSNPAAAAADYNRNAGKPFRGTVVSFAAGLEYGNVQELFDLYDDITGGYEPSEPGEGPVNLPEPHPGIDETRIRHAESFDLFEVSRYHDLSPRFSQRLQRGGRDRRPFFGIGAARDFIDQRQLTG